MTTLMMTEFEDSRQIRSDLMFNFRSTPRSRFKLDERTTYYRASGENDKFGAAAITTSEFSQVLLVSVHNLIYPITEKELHQVFDPYGCIENIIITSTTSYGLQALIHFQSFHCAIQAKNHLHGRNMYGGCCQLDIQHFKSGYNAGSLNQGHNDSLNCINEMVTTVEKMLYSVKSMQTAIERIEYLHTQKCELFNSFFKSGKSSKLKVNNSVADLRSASKSRTKLSATKNVNAPKKSTSSIAQTIKPHEKSNEADLNHAFMLVKMVDECKMLVDRKMFDLNNALMVVTTVRFLDNVSIFSKLPKDNLDSKIVNWIDQVLDEMHLIGSLMLDGTTDFFVFDPGGGVYDVDMWRKHDGTIRNIMNGTVFREPIICKNVLVLVPGWRKPICVERHAFSDQYRATNVVINIPRRLKLVHEGAEQQEDLEVFNFIVARGVAIALYRQNYWEHEYYVQFEEGEREQKMYNLHYKTIFPIPALGLHFFNLDFDIDLKTLLPSFSSSIKLPPQCDFKAWNKAGYLIDKESMVESSRVINDIKDIMKEMEESDFYMYMRNELKKKPEVKLLVSHKLGYEKMVQMVLYGAGSVEQLYDSRIQFALALLLK